MLGTCGTLPAASPCHGRRAPGPGARRGEDTVNRRPRHGNRDWPKTFNHAAQKQTRLGAWGTAFQRPATPAPRRPCPPCASQSRPGLSRFPLTCGPARAVCPHCHGPARILTSISAEFPQPAKPAGRCRCARWTGSHPQAAPPHLPRPAPRSSPRDRLGPTARAASPLQIRARKRCPSTLGPRLPRRSTGAGMMRTRSRVAGRSVVFARRRRRIGMSWSCWLMAVGGNGLLLENN